MIATIALIIGFLCCLWCIKDVWSKTKIDTVVKLVLTVALIATNWIGLAVYYFLLKDRL